MRVTFVLVVSIGLWGATFSHPSGGDNPKGQDDVLKQTASAESSVIGTKSGTAEECKINCAKENESTNKKETEENNIKENTATDNKNATLDIPSSNDSTEKTPNDEKKVVVKKVDDVDLKELIDSIFNSHNVTTDTNKETTESSNESTDNSHETSQNSNETISTGTYIDHASSKNDTETSLSKCKCVRYYLCQDLHPDEGLIDIPYNIENECPHYLDTCCYNFTTELVEPPTSPTTLASVTSATKEPQPSQPPPTVWEGECGRSVVLDTKPLNGGQGSTTSDKAQYGEFPWMVWIGDSSLTTLCGGSLIHPRVVLTGAHCVNGKEDVVIRAGEWNIKTQAKEELSPHQEVKVKEIVVHDKFNNGSLWNDPALLILEAPVNLTDYVGLICLPEAQEDMSGRQCLTSGWGRRPDDEKESEDQSILKRVGPLPIVPQAKCQEELRKTKLGGHFRLHETFICAGGTPGRDACKGDGGGPLVCPSRKDPSVYVQAGIVAWGISCGTDTPGVYVNVPHFVPWVADQLRAKGVLPNSNEDDELDESQSLIDIHT